jgi:hypothetical protein
VLAVLDREREEVDAFAGAVGAHGRDQQHRVAVADDARAVGLFGDAADLDRELAVAELNLLFQKFLGCHVFSSPPGALPWREAAARGVSSAARRPLLIVRRRPPRPALREARGRDGC